MEQKLEKGSIVQIANEDHQWFPCLIVVDEIKSFGIQGYIVMPTNDKEPNMPAYIRLKAEDYILVGQVAFGTP